MSDRKAVHHVPIIETGRSSFSLDLHTRSLMNKGRGGFEIWRDDTDLWSAWDRKKPGNVGLVDPYLGNQSTRISYPGNQSNQISSLLKKSGMSDSLSKIMSDKSISDTKGRFFTTGRDGNFGEPFNSRTPFSDLNQVRRVPILLKNERSEPSSSATSPLKAPGLIQRSTNIPTQPGLYKTPAPKVPAKRSAERRSSLPVFPRSTVNEYLQSERQHINEYSNGIQETINDEFTQSDVGTRKTSHYTGKSSEGSRDRHVSQPPLRRSQSSLTSVNGDGGVKPSRKTTVKIRKSETDSGSASTLSRGPGRFSLKLKPGERSKNFLTPTFSSLTRSLSGMNLSDKTGSLKKYSSSTDIKQAGMPMPPARKTSLPSLPRTENSLPGRKISLPSFSRTEDNVPVRKTSDAAGTLRPGSDTSFFGKPPWNLPGRKISSTSSLPPVSSKKEAVRSSSSSSLPGTSSFTPLLSSMTRKLTPGTVSGSSSKLQSADGSQEQRVRRPSGLSLQSGSPRSSPESNRSQDDLVPFEARRENIPSRSWPYSSILKTPGKRKSSMKHVEFLDNLSECEYVAREY